MSPEHIPYLAHEDKMWGVFWEPKVWIFIYSVYVVGLLYGLTLIVA